MAYNRPTHEKLSHHELSQFSGGDEVYKYRLAGNMPWMTLRESPFGPLKVTYTQGVKYIRDNGAGWLIDAIASHLPKVAKNKEYATKHWWILKPDGKGGALLFCTDNRRKPDNPLVTQKIDTTDFPFNGGTQPFVLCGGTTTIGGDNGEPTNVMHLWLLSED